VLVARYDISPWRFFGWAMYCQPKLSLEVDVYVRRNGVRLPVTETQSDLSELQRQRLDYVRRREMWGALLPPDHLARETLQAVGEAEAVEIIVRRLVLQASTAHIEARQQVYSYPRSAPGDR
jgi:hypothetical protein